MYQPPEVIPRLLERDGRMSPVQLIAGHNMEPFATDIWTCGVTLFFLLTRAYSFVRSALRDEMEDGGAGSTR